MSGLEGLLTGQTLVNRYRIQEVIGRGGFAAVYRAEDERLGRQVAVKVITVSTPDPAAAARHRERFEKEARAAASLPQHPNIVTVYDFGVDPALGLDFLVMEFLHGEDLATALRRSGRPPLNESLRIIGEASTGVAVGHRAGIVHRDVKPGNIFLAQHESSDHRRVCILDFGIARVVTEDQTLTSVPADGTPLSPAYASPEQMRGASHLTPASDVFSLGVVAYQLLTGEKPFTASRSSDPSEWVPRRSVRELNADVPGALEAVIRRALAYHPDDRYRDAEDFAAALASPSGSAAPLPAPPPLAAPATGAAPSERDVDRTLYQPEEASRSPRERQRLVFNEAPPPRRRSVFNLVLLVVLLLGGGAAGIWFFSGEGGAPIDPSAQEDLDAVADGVGEDEAEGGEETERLPEPRSTGSTPGATLPVIPSPLVLDSAAGDTLIGTTDAESVFIDSLSASPGDIEGDSTAFPPDSLLPPPRVIGVPVDSTSSPGLTPAEESRP